MTTLREKLEKSTIVLVGRAYNQMDLMLCDQGMNENPWFFNAIRYFDLFKPNLKSPERRSVVVQELSCFYAINIDENYNIFDGDINYGSKALKSFKKYVTDMNISSNDLRNFKLTNLPDHRVNSDIPFWQ